jgi:hypothetical protein
MLSNFGFKIKNKGKEKKGEVITPRLYARVFGVHKHELWAKWNA